MSMMLQVIIDCCDLVVFIVDCCDMVVFSVDYFECDLT